MLPGPFSRHPTPLPRKPRRQSLGIRPHAVLARLVQEDQRQPERQGDKDVLDRDALYPSAVLFFWQSSGSAHPSQEDVLEEGNI